MCRARPKHGHKVGRTRRGVFQVSTRLCRVLYSLPQRGASCAMISALVSPNRWQDQQYAQKSTMVCTTCNTTFENMQRSRQLRCIYRHQLPHCATAWCVQNTLQPSVAMAWKRPWECSTRPACNGKQPAPPTHPDRTRVAAAPVTYRLKQVKQSQPDSRHAGVCAHLHTSTHSP